MAIGVYLINLDRDTERLAFMDEQLRRIGLSYERIAAVDGTDPVAAAAYDADDAARYTGYRMSPGEVGCALSHRRAYELMTQRAQEYALVLEDDVELPSDFNEIVQREVARADGQWEYLLFDYWEPGALSRSLWYRSARLALRRAAQRGFISAVRAAAVTLAKAVYIIPLSFFEGWRNRSMRKHPGPVTFYRPVYLAGAYLVSASGARKLLSLATPLRYPADRLPNQARVQLGLAFKAYAPVCVRQRKERFGSSMLGLSGKDIWGDDVPARFRTDGVS